MAERRPEPEDLSVQVRRGQASRLEQRDLLQTIARDPAVRVAHQVGLDFDQETAVRSGDEDLILRAADAALARMMPVAPSAVRSRPWWMAAAVVMMAVLSVSGMGAALWVAGITPWHKPNVSPSAPPVRVLHRPNVRRASEEAGAAVEPPVQVAPTASAQEPRTSSHRAPQVSAAELFRSANSARRAGELVRAKHLYAQLIHQAPSSEEAHVARVSLGKLLLVQGQYAESERAFRQYLTAGGGPLSEEALFNRAECLGKLKRARDETSAWRALLAAFPDSLYASRAKERLSMLSKEQ
jgi:TolA-binding protein